MRPSNLLSNLKRKIVSHAKNSRTSEESLGKKKKFLEKRMNFWNVRIEMKYMIWVCNIIRVRICLINKYGFKCATCLREPRILINCSYIGKSLKTNCIIDHTYREGNKCADWLANIGVDAGGNAVIGFTFVYQCYQWILFFILGETYRRVGCLASWKFWFCSFIFK